MTREQRIDMAIAKINSIMEGIDRGMQAATTIDDYYDNPKTIPYERVSTGAEEPAG